MSKLLITGATGFIGKPLITMLAAKKNTVSAVVRRECTRLPSNVVQIKVSDVASVTHWHPVLADIDVVIHLAGRAHIMNDGANSLGEFRKVNTHATLRLAKESAKANVKRFIFISSIGVNGVSNTTPFVESDNSNGREPYAISKREAEQGLLSLAKEVAMQVVIIRPPLVYGPNAPGNFARLVELVNKGVPLPLGEINNRRSLVALDNMVSFIVHCIDHPKAANEVFLISDGEDVSTTELLQKVAKAFGKRAFLLPIPVSWMIFAAKLVGMSDVAKRLFGSLQVDSSKARELLGWEPVITMDEQLKKTAEAYLNEKTV